ncbi:glutamate mutase L [Nocardioides dubius]|uniref:Methylaspartate mutase accessory protein GlmL n=1 Tax=Nocardioides dubius TaxID=317019 RepID=A0ABP4EL03_9ACTN
MSPAAREQGVALCVDYGSTFTKAVLVDLGVARIVARTSHRTTIDTDLIDGFDACRNALAAEDPRALEAPVYAASSAGGGLRILVVGNERLVTAEAGHRVALGSGGKVIDVVAAAEHPAFADRIDAAQPDLVLLVGGTDGGNPAPLVAAAEEIARASWGGPIVVAGNVEAQPAAVAALDGRAVVTAANVMPRIGTLQPGPAREAVRGMFLRHVIGGKHLSSDPRFAAMLVGATPDVVLTGMELLSHNGSAGRTDLVLVDVGGATTDVYSVVEVDPEDAGLAREVVATTPLTRTVEGDLGMRWSAVETAHAGIAAGLLDETILPPAERRRADPDWLPLSAAEAEEERRLATAAIRLALGRHAGGAGIARLDPHTPDAVRSPESEGRGPDLRTAAVLIGSGGVLRETDASNAHGILAAALVAPASARLPESPLLVVDDQVLLTAAGLLAAAHPQAAAALVRGVLDHAHVVSER